MDEKTLTHEGEPAGTYQNLPDPVKSPGEKIAELSRRDRQMHPINQSDRLEDAPEFSPENIPSESSSIHRVASKPKRYGQSRTGRETLAHAQHQSHKSTGGAALLWKLETLVRERPAAAIAVSVVAGFAMGRIIR